MTTEAAKRADFTSILRYAQVWEDADVLLEALDIQPGETCLSIASAGDNAFAMLIKDPARVYAIDLNPTQLAAVELRIAAYRLLSHPEFLELVGSIPSLRRLDLYGRLASELSGPARQFWDSQADAVRDLGIGGAGKFERYFQLFRQRFLPRVHRPSTVEALLVSRSREERGKFYESNWNTIAWRLMFRTFFSSSVMGRLGRDPAFFKYVEGSVADRILARTRHALTHLDPHENPYLQWILTGQHRTALPVALRREHFDTIRSRLDRVECRCVALEDFLDCVPARSIARFNLSDIFEYMSPENHRRILERILEAGSPGGRLVYWNMLVPRRRPDDMADLLTSLDDVASKLFLEDKAFFYSALVVERIGAPRAGQPLEPAKEPHP